MTNKNSIVVAILLALALPARGGTQDFNWDQGVNLKRITAGFNKRSPAAKATLVSDAINDQSPVSSDSLPYELEQATSKNGAIYFFSVAGDHPVDSSGNNLAVFTYTYTDRELYESEQELEECDAYEVPFGTSQKSQIPDGQRCPANWKLGSNVAVYVAPNSSIDHIDPLNIWVDPGGRIHSLDVLRRQLEFRTWYRRRATYDHFDLTAGRQNIFHIPTPTITGIMDRNTLNIPLIKLEWHYDAAYSSFLASCGKIASSQCSGAPWPNEFLNHWATALETARGALDNLANLLASIPFSMSGSVRASGIPLERSSENQYGGLPISFSDFPRWVLVYSLVRQWPQNFPQIQCSDNQTNCLLEISLVPSPNEPETQVTEFVDPHSISPDLIEAIQQAQNEAKKAIKNAETLVPPTIQ